MTDLKRALEEAVAAAFTAAGLSEDYARVTPSDRPDLADFQCNGALIAAKPSKRNPREIAIAVTEHLAGNPLLASVEIAGAGFINMRVSTAALSDRASQVAADPRTGALRVAESRRVIIDYGGPNVAKPMHVGHLRSAIIGEAIKRIYRFRGDEVLGDAHFGDWGFQMGLLICAVSDADPRWKTVAEELWRTPDVKAHQEQKVVDDLLDGLDLDVLDRLYPLASTRAKADPEFRDRARKATAELQSGKPGYLTLWRRFVEVSREALKREYHTLGIDFDLWKGESDVEALIAPMVEDLKDKGLLEPDQGALIVRVDRNGETRPKKLADGTVITAPYPDPLLVVSSEGSAMYGTTDLATVLDRQKTYDPQLVLYCVDQRQAEHFEIVFRAAYLAKYAEPAALEHIGFGTMNGTDGKPFKTREGGVLKLRDLIGMTTEKASDRLHEAGLGAELPPKEFEDIARKVAVAALKFADLQNFRGTSYVFDLDRFSSFEGKTGPYLLYQAVRIKSILRRVEAQGASNLATVIIAEPAERELALLLDAFGHAVAESYDRKAPHFIAEHAFRLAQGFSKFYAACPVLNAPEAIKASRLALSATVLRQLETALDLLGIETPERM